jgi:hypothetical protein
MPKNSTELDSPDTLVFNSTLKNKEITKCFHEYLTEIKFSNRWDFIMSAQVLNAQIDKGEYIPAIEQIKHIIHTFFTSETKPLNLISQNTKDIVSKISENWKNQSLIEIKMLIDVLQQLLIKDYQTIYFPNFLKTPVAQKLTKKYKKDKKVVVPKLSQLFEYENIDFESETFNPKDLEFVRHFESENYQHWDSIYVSDEIKCYKSNRNYFPNLTFVENLDNVVLEFTFNFSFEETVCALMHNFFDKDQSIVYCKVVDYVEKEYVLIDQHVRIPASIPRYKRYLSSMHYESGKFFLINKPVKIGKVDFLEKTLADIYHPKTKKFQKENAIQDFLFQSAVITKISENKTKFKYLTHLDLGFGSWGVPNTLIKWKAQGLYSMFILQLKKLNFKKFQDLKEELSKMKDGLPLNPLGKLLCDLNIFKESPKPKTDSLVMLNIMGMIKQDSPNDLDQNSVNSIVHSNITSNISNFELKENKETKQKVQTFQFQPRDKNGGKQETKGDLDLSFLELDFSEIVDKVDYISEANVSNEMLSKLDSLESLGSMNLFSEIDDLIEMINHEDEKEFMNLFD